MMQRKEIGECILGEIEVYFMLYVRYELDFGVCSLKVVLVRDKVIVNHVGYNLQYIEQ